MSEITITAVRVSEMHETGKSGDVMAMYPHNKGSGIILEKGCKVEAEIDGKWETLWEVRISNRIRYGQVDITQLCKEDAMGDLIELIKKYKKFLKAAITKEFKDIYQAKIAGLELAFDSIAAKGEIGPETLMLCHLKDQILKDE